MRSLPLLFLVGLATGFISEKLFVSSQSPSSSVDDLYLEGRTSGDLPIDDEDGEDGSGSGSGDDSFIDFSDQEEIIKRFFNYSRTPGPKVILPSQPQPTADSPPNPPTTAADSQDQPTKVKETETTSFMNPDGNEGGHEVTDTGPTADFTHTPSTSDTTKIDKDISVTKDGDEDNSLDVWDVSTTKVNEEDVQVKEIDNEIVVKDGRGSRIYEVESPEEVHSENLWERTEVLAAVIACGVVGFICAVSLLLLLAYRMKKKDEGSYELGDTKLSTTSYHKAPTKEFYA